MVFEEKEYIASESKICQFTSFVFLVIAPISVFA